MAAEVTSAVELVPGDREDIEGEPFVGPAGAVLAKALDAASVACTRRRAPGRSRRASPGSKPS